MRFGKRLALVLGLLSWSIPASAAYTTATISAIDSPMSSSGSIRLVVLCAGGTAGEPDTPVDVAMQGGISALSELRLQAFSACDAVSRNFVVRQLLTVGQVLARFTPTPPPVVGPAQFSSSPLAFTPGATPQDVCTLTGSATRTLSVMRASISSTQTTAGVNVWTLVKRSTANTGGTSTTVTPVPVDTLSPAATATTLTYTVNPTAGTLAGRYTVDHVVSPSVTTAGLGVVRHELLANGSGFTAPIVLRGAAEVLAINFNGAVLPAGLSVACSFSWAE